MPATVKSIRTSVTLRSDEEIRAWVQFAAGAAVNVAGESDNVNEDARECASLADALIVQLRKRCER